MNNQSAIAFFDFDGTLTDRDSFGDFIRFAFGWHKACSGAIVLAPTLLAYGLRLLDNSAAKQKVLQYFFAGMREDELIRLGQQYAQQRIPRILKAAGLEKLLWHQQQGHQVVIVTASADIWLHYWTHTLGIALLATKLEVMDGVITGRYQGNNCHGAEKVRRIKQAYRLESYKEIYAYGDTAGDKPMLALADFAFYRFF